MNISQRQKSTMNIALSEFFDLLFRIDDRLENIERLLQQKEAIEEKPLVENYTVEEHSGPDWQSKLLLSVQEVAEILSISKHTVYNQISLCTFPIKHYKRGRRVLFKTDEVKKYIVHLGS